MKRSLAILAIVAVLTASAGGQLMQAMQGSPDSRPTQPAKPPGPRTFTATVGAMATSQPALRYLLLPDVVDQTSGDAMTLYMTAGDNKPGSTGNLDQEISSWVSAPIKDVPLEQAKTAVDQYRSCLHQVELATRRETCRWELPIRGEGISMIIPTLSKPRAMARALALRIRLEILDKQFDKAAKDLQIGYAMAKQVGEGPTLINALVGVAIAELMSQRLLEFVQADGAPNLYWPLADLPTPLIDFRQAWQAERDLIYLTYPRLKELREAQLTAVQWQALTYDILKAMGMATSASDEGGPRGGLQTGLAFTLMKLYPPGKKYLLDKGMTKEQVEAMPVMQVAATYALEGYEGLRDETFKWNSLPYWQAHEGHRKAQRAIKEAKSKGVGWPFSILLPSLVRAQFLQARCDRTIAVLRYIEAVRDYAASHDGQLPPEEWFDQAAAPGSTADLPLPLDPVLGKPFKCIVAGDKLVIDCLVFPDMPVGDQDRYEITIRKLSARD